MKKNPISYFILPLLMAAVITGCTQEPITMDTGKLPDEAAMQIVGGVLRSNFSFSGRATINLLVDEDEEPQAVVADELVYNLGKPAQNEVKATLSIGTELTDEFLAEVERVNEQIKIYSRRTTIIGLDANLKDPALFPVENVQLESSNLSVPAGKSVSENVRITLSNEGLDPGTIYLLPIVVEQGVSGTNLTPKSQVLQYLINVRPKRLNWENAMNPGEDISMDEEFFTVFYVNTETYQPLIADIFIYEKANWSIGEMKYYSFGNIVNLKPSMVEYDNTSGRVLFSPGNDLRYVLEHAEKYIRPLQNRGRKVCITIENGGKGIGFCNMTDAQITDFSRQVKDIVELYDLDGINLWDEGNGYGKEGMPAVNTTSYPKLIKALREALPDKLLTLVDKGEPTEYFYDVDKCGGIEVGNYIDYAWHGYASESEVGQIVEPWAFDHPYSEYTRKPIAGLTPERYGNIVLVREMARPYEISFESQNRIVQWKSAGRKKNNIVVFSFDLTANEQGPYEGEPENVFINFNFIADEGVFWGQNPWDEEWGQQFSDIFYMPGQSDPLYHHGYRLYVKDW